MGVMEMGMTLVLMLVLVMIRYHWGALARDQAPCKHLVYCVF